MSTDGEQSVRLPTEDVRLIRATKPTLRSWLLTTESSRISIYIDDCLDVAL